MRWFNPLIRWRRKSAKKQAELVAAAELQRRLLRYAEPRESTEAAGDPSKETHDVWLQDAMWFAAHGRWFGAREVIKTTSDDLLRVTEVARRMRQLAKEGEYDIWGKTASDPLHRKIPAGFWADNQIDVLRLVTDGDAENVCTEAGTGGASERYASLRVNKSATERLWPAMIANGALPSRRPEPVPMAN